VTDWNAVEIGRVVDARDGDGGRRPAAAEHQVVPRRRGARGAAAHELDVERHLGETCADQVLGAPEVPSITSRGTLLAFSGLMLGLLVSIALLPPVGVGSVP
jgi:hypothetical protein